MSAQKMPFSTFGTSSGCNVSFYRLAFIPFLHDFSLPNTLIATPLDLLSRTRSFDSMIMPFVGERWVKMIPNLNLQARRLDFNS